jgi:hypothetical protein
MWPYNISGIGRPDYQTAVNSWLSRPFPYRNVWSPDAIQAARLGLGDSAFIGMENMLATNQSYPNGFPNNINGVFDFFGAHLLAMNESMLQSYNDTIRVFPALPSDSTFVSKFTLLAKGGFLVSSERETGGIKYVGIKSLYGKPATIVNPWPNQWVQVRRTSDNGVLSLSTDSTISFATSAGNVYVLERTATLLSSYAFVQLTASPNGSAKSMKYKSTTITLGAGTGAPPTGVMPAKQAHPALPAPAERIFKVSGSRFSIQTPGARNRYSVEVYDLSGRLVRAIVAGKTVIDMGKDIGAAQGVYIVKVKSLDIP